MIVLDTTVLVYAVGAEHRHAEPCRRLIGAIVAGHVRATTAVEAVQEFAHVYARRRSRREAVRVARKYVEALGPLISFEQGDLEEGLRLFERHSALGAFDGLLAAATIARDEHVLVSADEGFRAIPRLTLVEPGTAAFDRLLGA